MLSNDIAVLERGRIVQRGSARVLAGSPASAFVADLTGAFVLNGVAAAGPDSLTVVRLAGGFQLLSTDRLRGPVAASVHPWEVTLERAGEPPHGSAQNRVPVRVAAIVPLGGRVRIALESEAGGHFLSAEVTEPAVRALRLSPGMAVLASWKATATRLAAA
jgi:molybdate transport system ATP-binding protein